MMVAHSLSLSHSPLALTTNFSRLFLLSIHPVTQGHVGSYIFQRHQEEDMVAIGVLLANIILTVDVNDIGLVTALSA